MENDTKQKIKEAARKVFKQKGYAATRTRDIADEAGVNLALLNYHFKSKEQLFVEVMMEIVGTFKQSIYEFLNDETLDFGRNLQRLVDSYTELFLREPELPIFVFGELQKHPQDFSEIINPRNLILGSRFEKQMSERLKNPDIDTPQIFINTISMIVFPFIGKPITQNFCGIDEEGFKEMVEHRRKMIPIWIESIINTLSK